MGDWKEFTSEELAEYRGEDGKAVYIAHQGRVIDVSNSRLWKGGLHMRRHHAGTDLTTDIQAAPHGLEVLERYPQVGILKMAGKPLDRPLPAGLAALLQRFPMLKRHPHPMTVHFPIVFPLAAAAFVVIYLWTGIRSFEVTAFHCLGAANLFIPIAIGTGLFTWWYNYLAKPLRPVRIKKRLSPLLWLLVLAAFSWRLAVPDILESIRPASYVYLLMVLGLVPVVMVIGWFGAQMTFPIDRE
ncbi:MAG TPA: cytochrome b5 [Syntrophobacteraceae bacterium]|nr:cytochrome b5 [Syntrophobacteraceae bacterium]